ncbi:hypothetical protein M758_4G115400 [Ceratodon purpureus]|nr:hypothetical protein M758_4G115400 [Ceratodon purpureus]
MAPRPSRNLKEDATVLKDMKDDVAMDPTLWGNLKDYVAMEIIYAKVPFHEFFQLRVVCKEWNHLAGDRKFLEDHFKEYLVPEPYFYIPGGCEYLLPKPYVKDGRCMNGFVTVDITSEDVGWIGLNNPWKDRGRCFAVNGLIYSETVPSPDYLWARPSPDYLWARKRTREVLQMRAESRRQEVFNIHTRVRHKLPPTQLSTAIPVVGMLVDTSARPYGFKVIQGCGDLGTQIFDSKTNRLFKANAGQVFCLTWDVGNHSRHKWEPYDGMPKDLRDWVFNDNLTNKPLLRSRSSHIFPPCWLPSLTFLPLPPQACTCWTSTLDFKSTLKCTDSTVSLNY